MASALASTRPGWSSTSPPFGGCGTAAAPAFPAECRPERRQGRQHAKPSPSLPLVPAFAGFPRSAWTPACLVGLGAVACARTPSLVASPRAQSPVQCGHGLRRGPPPPGVVRWTRRHEPILRRSATRCAVTYANYFGCFRLVLAPALVPYPSSRRRLQGRRLQPASHREDIPKA